MSTKTICPCAGLVHPRVITNPPGLDVIRYRGGDFASFREALLAPLPGEVDLRQWRPGATGDLAVQIIEWWAVLADILTFYDERIANQFFLRTADDASAVDHLVRLLGYRPRPAIGAAGVLAALVKGERPVLIPAGFQIQSKPGPGETPQTFEVNQATTALPGGVVNVDPPGSGAVGTSILVAGEGTGIKTGDQLLLTNRGWAAGAGDFAAFVTVKAVASEADPRGKKNTRVTFTAAVAPPAGMSAADLRLLRGSQAVGLWQYAANTYVTASAAHLASLVRQMEVGSPVVIEAGGSRFFVSVTSNSEVVWYANAPNPANPDVGPNPANAVPIPIPHTVLGFKGTVTLSTITNNRASTRFRYGWTETGRVIAAPAATFAAAAATLTVAPGDAAPALASGASVLIEDAALNGAAATVVSATAAQIAVTDVAGAGSPLKAPLRLLTNLVPVSRGKTVENEILGSGDASVAGQEFILKKSPLTYLAGADPSGTKNYHSTLRVWVNGIEWREAPSFYGQSPQAAVFVTREDTEDKTHVMFGDGVNGARLPAGTANVVASYRYGGGAATPDTGKLTAMLKPIAGMRGVANPVAPAGGADRDSPARLRTLAPRSVLTFNRAVSGADYEAIAAEAPGVARAKAYWSFDAGRQQTVVTVYVGDTDGAVSAARLALANAVDPNKPLVVKKATALTLSFWLLLVVDPAYKAEQVKAGVVAALTDPDAGVFGTAKARIGQTVFRSQIHEACTRVAGVVAAPLFLAFQKPTQPDYYFLTYKAYAGEGKYFYLPPENLSIWVTG